MCLSVCPSSYNLLVCLSLMLQQLACLSSHYVATWLSVCPHIATLGLEERPVGKAIVGYIITSHQAIHPSNPCLCWKTFISLDIPSSYAKILGGNKISPSGVSLKWVNSRRRKKKERKKKKKVGENNGQLRLRLPPRVAQASCLDQKLCTSNESACNPLSVQSSIAISLSSKCYLLELKRK